MARQTDHRSRLERMIARLVTQRACIDFAAEKIRDLSGPVLELGLGKGRTYDYLRKTLGDRDIFVFDKAVHAPPDCIPEDDYLLIGDFGDTLARFAQQAVPPAALTHADIGSEDLAEDARLAQRIAPLIHRLSQPGALVLCDRALDHPQWHPLPLPPTAGRWDYFIYQLPASAGR